MQTRLKLPSYFAHAGPTTRSRIALNLEISIHSNRHLRAASLASSPFQSNMSSATTPSEEPTKRSRSQNRPTVSRPTTPLRPSSRSSLRESQSRGGASGHGISPLDSLEPGFAELSDSMADLEANFMHLQLMHESLARFSESFASFLYGLNMNAFCADFPEVYLQLLSFHSIVLILLQGANTGVFQETRGTRTVIRYVVLP